MRLGTHSRIIAWRLAEGRLVTSAELFHAIYGNDPDGGPISGENIISCLVHQLNAKLHKFFRVRICNQRGVGWFVRSADLEWFRDVIANEIERNGDGKQPGRRANWLLASAAKTPVSRSTQLESHSC